MQKSLSYIRTQLSKIYSSREIQSFIYLIFEHLLGFSKTDLIVNSSQKLTEEQFQQVEKIVLALIQQQPIQYILGKTEFYGLPFIVNKNVLIPRPETEELVDRIAKENSADKSYKILDIGTGSACIAISLATLFSDSKIWASDIALESIHVAKENATLNRVKNITFIQDDILQSTISETFDIIVSNPPYVTLKQKAEMRINVVKYEPHRALFVPENEPLLFYKAIAGFAQKNLAPKGKVYLEINEELGAETAHIYRELGYKTQIIKDINGKERFVYAQK